MGRNREIPSGMGLLLRMEARPWSNGKTITYRYHPVGKKPINLGTDKVEAIRKVLDLNDAREFGPGAKGTLLWVWERFKESTRWKKLADGTRADYELAWKQINERLGEMHISTITPVDVATYVHQERAGSPRRADIEKSLLSRLFGHGIKLGVCTMNSTIGVEPHGSEARTHAVPPQVLAKFLDWINQQTPQRRIIGMAAEYASLAGSRKVEFLDLAWPQIDEVGGKVRTKRAKQRGAKRGEVIEVIDISPDLQRLIDRLKALRTERGLDCHYVFPTRDNNAYTARGFMTLWQRCVALALEEKVISENDRFTFHDLRAYYVTAHKQRLGVLPDLHTNPDVTARVYDRSKEIWRSSL